jgi:hypothetical protein
VAPGRKEIHPEIFDTCILDADPMDTINAQQHAILVIAAPVDSLEPFRNGRQRTFTPVLE